MCLAVALWSLTGFCQADAAKETRTMLENTINQGLEILKCSESSDEQKLKAFDGLLLKNCHTDLMSMLSLGKSGWEAFTPEQRTEFTTAFVNLMTRTYYTKLKQADVSAVVVDYKDNIEVSSSKRSIKTVMGQAGDGFNVDYKFALRKDRWAIYDMEVEGISLIASYRSQFTDFLKSKSAAALLAEMQSNEQEFSAKTIVK